MKTELTIEQSRRLIELGVSEDKASSIERKDVVRDGKEYVDFIPVFTLTDLLDILPKRIDDYHFSIDHNGDFYDVTYLEWDDDENWEAVVRGFICDGFAATELVDALYELTIFVYTNHYEQRT